MVSRAGATEAIGYMETQESGGLRRKKKPGATAIAQDVTREGMSNRKPVSRAMYYSTIKRRTLKGKFTRAKTKKAQTVASMFMAKKKEMYFRHNGVVSRVDYVKSINGKVRARVTNLYFSVKRPINIKKHPWLVPAMKRPVENMVDVYKYQLKKLWTSGAVI